MECLKSLILKLNLKRLMIENPKAFTMLLEWCDDEADTLEGYKLRDMYFFDEVFDGLTESELIDMQGNGFNRNHKYFYTDDGGYIFSINEKNYSTIIENHPYILDDLMEWLTETAERYGVEIERFVQALKNVARSK